MLAIPYIGPSGKPYNKVTIKLAVGPAGTSVLDSTGATVPYSATDMRQLWVYDYDAQTLTAYTQPKWSYDRAMLSRNVTQTPPVMTIENQTNASPNNTGWGLLFPVSDATTAQAVASVARIIQQVAPAGATVAQIVNGSGTIFQPPVSDNVNLVLAFGVYFNMIVKVTTASGIVYRLSPSFSQTYASAPMLVVDTVKNSRYNASGVMQTVASASNDPTALYAIDIGGAARLSALAIYAPWESSGQVYGPSGQSITNSLCNPSDAQNKGPWNVSNQTACCLGQHVDANGDLDTSICNPDWCPFGPTCQKNLTAISAYCATMDEAGFPRINTDANCQAWCNTGRMGNCATVMTDFCTKNPSHPTCGCMNYTSTPEYATMVATFFACAPSTTTASDAFGATPYLSAKQVQDDSNVCDGARVDHGANAEPCQPMPDPQCWAPVCTAHSSGGPDGYMSNGQMTNSFAGCSGVTDTFCSQVLNVTCSQNVNIPKVAFTQVCGAVPSNNVTHANAKKIAVVAGGVLAGIFVLTHLFGGKQKKVLHQ